MRALHVTLFGAVVALVASAACSTGGDDDLSPTDTSSLPDAGPGMPDSGGTTTTPPNACGNKKLDPNEECDDGNRADGDGCSSTCKRESAGPNDLCEGSAVELTRVGETTRYTAQIAGSTTNLFNHYGASCGGGSGRDAVYVIDAPKTGRATVTVRSNFAAVVSARTACEDVKSEVACGDASGAVAGGDGGTTNGGEVAFPVFEGKKTYLFVDGYGGESGDFTLDIDVQTAVCGNGQAESPEACDDGNTVSGDGCSAACELEDPSSPSACPGMGYRLGVGTTSFAGDTSTLANGGGNATLCEATGAGPNAIYALTPKVSGNLSLRLLADYAGAFLHVRRTCGTPATVADCRGASTTPERMPLSFDIPVDAEETVYVFVDGAVAANQGLYVLDATLTAGVCGNGKLDTGEECDDGGVEPGDGCSATCAVERDPETYVCPGKLVRLESAAAGPRTAKVFGITTPASGESTPASKLSSCGHTSAPDVVYRISSDIDGWLTAKVKGNFNATLQLRSTCTGGSDIVCAKAAGGTAEETLSAAIDKDKDYFLVVDGIAAGVSGAFELDLEVKPSVCGNSVVEGGETCDDGATDDGDGCDATCKLETDKKRDECATADLITLTEDGATGKWGTTVVSGTTNLTKPASPTHSMSPCSSTNPDGYYPFVAPISGVVTARITSATFRSTIGAREGCGTQITCDDANSKGGQEITFPVTQGLTYALQVGGGNVTGVPQIGRFTMDVDLVPSGCGDTIVSAPEQCDDGNTANGDGCSSTCTIEPLVGLNACPGRTVALTGVGAGARRAVLTLDTTGLPNKTGGACGGSGPEGILRLTSDIDGLLTVKSTAGHAEVLYARTDCGDPATEIAKASCSATELTTVSTFVTKNQPVYVFVDGMSGASGVVKLQITVAP